MSNSRWTWFRQFLGGAAFGSSSWPPLPVKLVVDDTESPITGGVPNLSPANEWWLLPHGVTGGLVLFLGPLQFSRRLRQRHLAWHRIAGRVYVVGVAVAVPLGIVIEAIKYTHGVAPLRLVVGSTGFGFLFALTTVAGFRLARRRRIRDHQQWMTRSYAIATVFLQTRCVDQFPWLGKILYPAIQALETHSISGL